VIHDLITIEPLLTKEIPVDSEGDIQESDVSMEDISDSDYTIKEEWKDWKVNRNSRLKCSEGNNNN